MKALKRYVFATVCTLLLSACLSAAQAARASAAVLDKLSAAGGQDNYPDANALVVENRREVAFNADGTYLDRNYMLVKVLTEPGKNAYSEAGFDYTRQYDAVKIKFAQVIKPDGTLIEVPEDMIKDVTHPELARMNIFDSNVRVQMVTFQNLEVGDAIEYEVVDSCFLAPVEGNYDLIELLQGTDPILYKRVALNGPNSRPLKYLVKAGQASFSTARKGERTEYVWEVRDVPRIVSEPSMPDLLSFAPRLLVSTFASWSEISRWWDDMTNKYRVANDSLRTVVQDITKGLDSDEAKILAVYHFVAQKIRYMGLGTGKKAGFEPKPASETLATRYGVCRDVAVLMSTMLDQLAIKSHVVLTRAGELVDPEIPTISFNHAIVALPDGKGGFRYADPTVENNPDLLLSVEGDASMLVCTKEGLDLQTSSHSPAADNLGGLTADSRIDNSGRLLSDVSLNTRGIYDYAFRGFIKQYPPAEVKNIMQRMITRIHPAARLTGFSTSDPEDLYTPFSLRFSYEVDDYAVQAGDYLLVRAPVSTNSFEFILRNFLADAGLPSREYPFNLGVTLGSEQVENLTLPAGYKVKSVPETVNLGAAGLSYQMQYDTSPPAENQPALKVKYAKKFLIDTKELDSKAYLELKKILRSSSRSGRGEIILVRDGQGNFRKTF